MDEKTERKIKKLARGLYRVWLNYVDSLPEEGNKQGKAEAYLNVTIFRNYVSVDSTHTVELKFKNQIAWYERPDSEEVKR